MTRAARGTALLQAALGDLIRAPLTYPGGRPVPCRVGERGAAVLRHPSGTTRPQRDFAIDIRKIADAQHLPEYGLRIDRDGKHELVSLFPSLAKPGRSPRGFRLSVIEAPP